MAALVCDLCGGKLVMGAGGIAVCDSCGMEHSADRMKEKVQEIKGTVRVDNTHMLSTYLEMAATALEAGNNEEAENYANKVIEIEPRSAKAWLYKGKAAGWQTTGRNNRYPESIVSWINAANFASADEKSEIEESIKNEAENISIAILQMECNSFVNYRSDDNKDDVTSALELIEKQLGLLKEKTEIDAYTDSLKLFLARAVNTCAVNASNNSDKDFGPEARNKSEYEWRKFTAAQDLCLTLLDKAYELSSDDNLCHTICQNYIAIAEVVRDSCSYKFQASAYGNSGYVKEYSFTQGAKATRTKAIDEKKEKRDLHDPEKRKANCNEAVKLYNQSCGEASRKLAIEQYWEAHASEKAALDNELAEIETKKSELSAEMANNSDKLQIEQLDNEMASANAQMNSLGLFKGKEKKEFAAKIDSLAATKKACEERWAVAKSQLEAKEKELNMRKYEVSAELAKDRGTAKIEPKQYLTVFENGAGIVSALDLVSYHKAILPDGITVSDEDENGLQNYSKFLLLKAQFMVRLLATLAGNTPDDEMDLEYKDTPDTIKQYRINFRVNGEPSNVSANFMGNTIDTPISNLLYYEFEGDKNANAVATFIKIVISSISGICPSIDLNGMEKKIAEAAYGLVPETSIEVDNLICTITGGTKNNLKFNIKPATAE